MGQFSVLLCKSRDALEHLLELGWLDVSICHLWVLLKELLPGLRCVSILWLENVALVSHIMHESEEKVLILKIMIPANMDNEKVCDELLAQNHGFRAVAGIALADQPGCEILSYEALLIR